MLSRAIYVWNIFMEKKNIPHRRPSSKLIEIHDEAEIAYENSGNIDVRFDEKYDRSYKSHVQSDPLWNIKLNPRKCEPDSPIQLEFTKFVDADSNSEITIKKDDNDEICINDEKIQK